MRMESDGHSRGNPRLYELVENAPKEGKSPTVWAWPQLIDYLKIAGQPVAGPWPPHQEPRPDLEEDTLPVAVADPESSPQRSPSRPGAPTIGDTDGGAVDAGTGADSAATTGTATTGTAHDAADPGAPHTGTAHTAGDDN
jgi:hypothetical protein